MPPKKSIFRQPGAQHFQLVHRSQRDPLYHDAEASKHVLKAFERENVKKGKSRAELEHILNPSDLAHDIERANIGEAASYGVYYDDTGYDYMQHLKPVGASEDGVESVLLQALSKANAKGKGKASDPITLKDLPPEALPSASELPRNFEGQEAIPSSIAGFRPDMDPHLRQTLEALEDDAFVDDGLEDDFFGELVADGERKEDEVEYDFDEDGLFEEGAEDGNNGMGLSGGSGWEAQFAQFKQAQKAGGAEANASSALDGDSEGGDTVGALPHLSVVGGKRSRKGMSDASGYSMSSSSMFRNAGLTTLDERFDQIEKQYASDEEDEDDDEQASLNGDEAPELITSREDFDSMMDEFLDKFEILGRKMKPVLEGGSGAEKLETLRRAMAEGGPVRVRDDDGSDEDILMPVDVDGVKDRWDCETILSTYSNLENHPRLIHARDSRPAPKIRLDPRTGLPSVQTETGPKTKISSQLRSLSPYDEETDDDDCERPARATITRPRDEAKEDKKARKQAAKAERQTRRIEKKATKEQFSAEVKHQKKALANKDTRTLRKL